MPKKEIERERASHTRKKISPNYFVAFLLPWEFQPTNEWPLIPCYLYIPSKFFFHIFVAFGSHLTFSFFPLFTCCSAEWFYKIIFRLWGKTTTKTIKLLFFFIGHLPVILHKKTDGKKTIKIKQNNDQHIKWNAKVSNKDKERERECW